MSEHTGDRAARDTAAPVSPLEELAAERNRWRESVLRGLLWTATITSAFALLFLGIQGLPMRGIGAALVLCVSAASLALGPRAPLVLRTLLLMGSIYVACVLSMVALGFPPNSLLGLAFVVLIATLLLGRGAGVTATAIGTTTLVAIALLHNEGVVQRSAQWWQAVDTLDLHAVARVVIIFAGSMCALVIGFSHLLERTERLFHERAVSLLALEEAELERERIAKKLEQHDAADRRARELELLGRLASYAAHDFNNALYVIQGNAELARRAASDPEELDAALRAIELAAHDASSTSRQLLALGHHSPTRTTTLSLAEQAERAERLLQRILATQIHVEVRTEPTPPIYADEGALQRILINLALNARDAMPEGGTLQIRVRPGSGDELGEDPEAELAVLEVSDTGTGMDAETVAHLFEPFFTTKGARGKGLGLASARELVESTSGQIRVHSEPGRGTRFSMYWPIAESEAMSLGSGISIRSAAPGLNTH